MNKKVIYTILFALTVTAFLLRFLPTGYGLRPFYWSDTFSFSKTLELMNGMIHGNLSVFGSVSHYPLFSSYILMFFIGGFYLVGLIGGIFSSIGECVKYAILNMDDLFELSRIVFAVLSSLLVPLVYFVTTKIVSTKNRLSQMTALIAPTLMCFSVLYIHYSHLVRPHVVLGFMLFLDFYLFLLLIEKKKLVHYVVLGVVCGLTAGTLHNGFLALIFLLAGHWFVVRQSTHRKVFIKPFVLALLGFIIAVMVCWPYLVLEPNETSGLINSKVDITLSGQSTVYGDFNGEGFIIDIGGLIFSETSLIVLLIISLFLYFLFLKNERPQNDFIEKSYKMPLIIVVIMLLVHFLIFGLYSVPVYKFLIPLVPFLCVFAGLLWIGILNKIPRKQKFCLIGLIILIMTFSIVQSIRLTVLIARKDTRNLATEWIIKNIDSSKMIAISSHGPKLFPNKQSLEKRTLLAGSDSLGQKDEFLLSLSSDEYPEQSMSIFPLWAFDGNEDMVYSFLKNHSDYFVFVQDDLFFQNPLKEFERKIANENGKIIISFNPCRNKLNCRLDFPNHVDNPIIDLWTINRMGPIIEIYKLK